MESSSMCAFETVFITAFEYHSLIVEWYSTIWLHHSWLSLSLDGPLVCFQFLIILN
jgi:hypothetical protein